MGDIAARLNAIADALETASKEARMLAEDVEDKFSATISTNDICKALQYANRRAGTKATNGNQQAYPTRSCTKQTADDK